MKWCLNVPLRAFSSSNAPKSNGQKVWRLFSLLALLFNGQEEEEQERGRTRKEKRRGAEKGCGALTCGRPCARRAR